MRPRTRLAVSGLVVQIGSTAFMTSPTSTACTGKSPNVGYAQAPSVAGHRAACFGLHQPA